MKYWVAIIAAALLVSCGGAPTAVTSQIVMDKIKAAGIAVTLDPGAPGTNSIPKTYLERQVFVIESIAPDGGQIFVCDTKKNCDAIYAYYDALKALAGPYLYQSPSGTVVAQLNSGLAPEEATKFDSVIKALP
jgi:hypothetical protein